MRIEDVSVLCMLYLSFCQTQKMGFLWIGMVVQWKCYCISKSNSAPKYTSVNAKLYPSMWWNYSGFYNNTSKLGTWRWGQWPQSKWGFGCGGQGQLQASCRRGSHSQGRPRPMGAAFICGSATGPGQSCGPTASQPCPWPRAAGPDFPALPGTLAGGGGMGLLSAKIATACLVITLSSWLPLLIPDSQCG